ncbi:MAG: MmgE/PrpD family protein [Streptosporangiaceae bacterium]
MSGHPSAATVLGRAAGETTFTDAPGPVRDRILYLVADVLATVVAACGRGDVARVRSGFPAGRGDATVVGRAEGADPGAAALLNGMAVAAEQLQDGHRLARGHPAAHVVPAVLAVAEASGGSGHAMLSAVLAGYEVGVRVGMAMGGTPDGVHDIATWGTVGAAAGVAHLLSGGSAPVIAAAVDLAAAIPVLPDAATVFGGSTGQHAFLGLGTHLGVVWGSLAAGGLQVPEGTLERHFGPLAGRSFDPSVIAGSVTPEGRWRQHAVLEGYVKRHPTCAHLHGANDAVEDVIARWHGDPRDIASVVVETYAGAAAFDDPGPANDLAARFSIPYTVAVALVRGRLDDDSFDRRWLDDGAVRDLAHRVEVRHRHDLDGGYPDGRPAIVTVHLRSGERVRAAASAPRGDGPGALDDAVVAGKPRRLLARRVSAPRAAAVLAAVDGLAAGGVAPLTRALRALSGDAGRVSPCPPATPGARSLSAGTSLPDRLLPESSFS